MKRAFIIAATMLVCGLVLQAATLEQLSLEDMVRKSSAIVRARVAGSYGAAYGSAIYTHYNIQVLERFKGPEASTFDVVLPGGAVAGRRQTFPGTPQLIAGQEYLLFLWTAPSGRNHVIGLSQGVLGVKRGENGELLAYRSGSADLMLNASGQTVRDLGLTIPLSNFRWRVATILASGVAK